MGRYRKNRKSNNPKILAGDFSAAATLFNATTTVRDQFWMKRHLSSPRAKRFNGSSNFRLPPQMSF
jgi:hypothetical protein